MAKLTNTASVDGLTDGEIAIANAADLYVVKFLDSGRWRQSLFRSFSEAQANAAMCPDPKAQIIAVSESGQKVTIGLAEVASSLRLG